MDIGEVNITPVKASGSLVAFASCVLNGSFYIGSIGLHKLLDGTGYRIVYPTKKVGNRQMHIYHPITKQAGQAIEQAIVERMKELFAYNVIEKSDEKDDRHRKTSATNQ